MTTIKKTVLGTGAALALFYAGHLGRSNAQSDLPPDSKKTNITWLGNAVYGVDAPDVIGGPFPRAEKGIEIGLRADGIVVWRKSKPIRDKDR